MPRAGAEPTNELTRLWQKNTLRRAENPFSVWWAYYPGRHTQWLVFYAYGRITFAKGD